MLRRALISAMIAAATAAALPAAPAQAVPSCGFTESCLTNYYSSSTYTTVVGQYLIDCGNVKSMWGRTTPYQRYFNSPCDIDPK